MHQETLKLVLSADTSSVTEEFDLKGKRTIQTQLYQETENTDDNFQIMITDLSDTPLLKKQPIKNLRSRDGGYRDNCPFEVQKDKVKVTITSNQPASIETVFTLVVDVEGSICK